MHIIRASYGYTDNVILDHVEEYGFGWMEDAIKHIQEDKYQHYQIMSMMFPMARTPMDAKGSRAMQKYSKQVDEVLLSLAPWLKPKKARGSIRHHGKIKSGEVVVVLDSGETADDPLYKNAKIIKSR